MMFSSGSISRFVDAHPTVKVLALSFLLLIGCSLIAEGFGVHIPKGYIYFAMGFSVFVELINLRVAEEAESAARQAARTGTDPRGNPGDDLILDAGVDR